MLLLVQLRGGSIAGGRKYFKILRNKSSRLHHFSPTCCGRAEISKQPLPRDGRFACRRKIGVIIYCDTDSLFSNPKRHKEDAKAQREAAAISRLLDYHRSGKLTMQRSNVALRELEETWNPIQRDNLRRDFLELVPIAKDETVFGFDNLQSEHYGVFVSNPISQTFKMNRSPSG